MRRLTVSKLLAALLATGVAASAHAVTFVNSVSISGSATDLAPGGSPNENRLGGFGSDLYYHKGTGLFYGLVDRGPGGGVISYNTRVQGFALDINSNTGAISNFNLKRTTLFRNNHGPYFNGLNPQLLNGNVSTLGNSMDPEGLVKNPGGGYFVSDEYGPSIRQFRADGVLVRTFTPPSNLLPKTASSTLDYVNGRPTITTGRQDNRGFEGLAVSPDGTKLYAVLQDPLVNEGASNDGRRSQNVRIVRYDVATGAADAQYVYQLESIADINNRIPGTASDFSATSQGRNIGVSGIVALNDHEFLVIERDNRGVGVDDPTGLNPIGSKRVYKIDINGATDVSTISMAGSNSLPGGVTPVSKSLFLDIQAQLVAAGLVVPEKIEGLTIGPELEDGSYLILVATDNDFSVTQTGSGTQLDVTNTGSQIPIGSDLPTGENLLPSYLYAFRATADELAGYQAPIYPTPEPATASLGVLTIAGLAMATRRRRAR